jgi:hypothetical protein
VEGGMTLPLKVRQRLTFIPGRRQADYSTSVYEVSTRLAILARNIPQISSALPTLVSELHAFRAISSVPSVPPKEERGTEAEDEQPKTDQSVDALQTAMSRLELVQVREPKAQLDNRALFASYLLLHQICHLGQTADFYSSLRDLTGYISLSTPSFYAQPARTWADLYPCFQVPGTPLILVCLPITLTCYSRQEYFKRSRPETTTPLHRSSVVTAARPLRVWTRFSWPLSLGRLTGCENTRGTCWVKLTFNCPTPGLRQTCYSVDWDLGPRGRPRPGKDERTKRKKSLGASWRVKDSSVLRIGSLAVDWCSNRGGLGMLPPNERYFLWWDEGTERVYPRQRSGRGLELARGV